MNSAYQYLSLFDEHRNLIDSKSPATLNALREKAAESLRIHGLPTEKEENFRHTNLDNLLAPDFGINISRVSFKVNPNDSFRCDVPHLSTSLFLVVNDAFASTEGCRDNLPEGVEVMSLASYCVRNPEFAAAYYGKQADINNPIVALNTMLCQDGVVIRVGKGVKVGPTLQIVNILNSLQPLMAVRRLLVVAEEDSEVRILACDHTQTPEVKLCNLQVVEIFAAKRSKVDFYDLEESTPATTRLSSLWLRQEEESEVLLDVVTLYNGTTRNELHTDFTGPRARLKMLGMGIEDERRRLDTFTRINHNVPDCNSDELFKYVVEGNAVGAFAGMIYVAEGATRTEAYQSNRNLLGSTEARMYSKPQLEIYNDDVKCSHGCAIGQLDQKQLFYLMTRGLPEDEARLLLKQAFMTDVLDAIELPPLRDRLRLLADRRLAGAPSSCTSCQVCHQ